MPDALLGSIWSDLFIPDVSLVEKVLRSLLVFVFLVVALRLGGKRELGQLNILDLAVLLLASNALQNAMIGADNSLLGGVVGAGTLFALNYVFVRLTFRSARARRLLEGTPRVLLEHGQVPGTRCGARRSRSRSSGQRRSSAGSSASTTSS